MNGSCHPASGYPHPRPLPSVVNKSKPSTTTSSQSDCRSVVIRMNGSSVFKTTSKRYVEPCFYPSRHMRWLVWFVRKDLMPRITSRCVDQVAAGGRKIVGVAVANKGAVMISFSLNGSTSLCFVGFCTLKHSSIFSRSLNSTLISSRVAVKSDALSSEVEVEITQSTFVVRLESLISDEPVTS